MAKLKTQIVIVGGGVAGLELAARLGRKYRKQHFDIVLVERNRTHLWKPLLHEVAAGSLDANLEEIGYRAHCHRWGYRYFFGSLQSVDRDKREVVVAPLIDDDGSQIVGEHRIRFDYLVLALGSVSNDFGTPGVAENCLYLDTPDHADRFRHKLLNHCLRVSRAMTENPAADEHVDIAVIGGGATGVELAAELFNAASALRHYGLEVFDESRLNVSLLEAGPRILPALPDELSEAAHEVLTNLGVTIRTNARVTDVSKSGIKVANGPFIPAHLRVWAAGVKGPAVLSKIAGLETNRRDQIVVTSTLQTEQDNRIFAIGDCASFIAPGSVTPVPPRAQAAHQMARTAFRNLVAMIDGDRRLDTFIYKDRGSLVSLSHYSTVGSLMGNLVGGRMAIEGRLARLAYVSLYRMHLITIHGALPGIGQIVTGKINKAVRPRLKLH